MKQDKHPVEVAVRALDVGYFNTKYTLGRTLKGDSNPIQVAMFPSIAPALTATDMLGSKGAVEADVSIVRLNKVLYVVGPGAINFTSGSEPRTVERDYCRTDKYLALCLGAMDYMAAAANASLEFVIGTLVVGLPLNTYVKHSDNLAQKLSGEHLIEGKPGEVRRRITVRNVEVMVQPHGALVHFGCRRSAAALAGWNLVMDPGGGTLDWFMSNGEEPAFKRSGAYPKAMLHCAYAVADSISAEWRYQVPIMTIIDEALRARAPTFTVGTRTYEMADFRPAVDAVLREAVKVMTERTGPLDAVRRILLTGGGAGVLREFLARAMPELEAAIELEDEPVFSNVRGFHAAGEANAQGI